MLNLVHPDPDLLKLGKGRIIRKVAKVRSLVSMLFFFSFLGLQLWHLEAPGLGVESGLQLLAYTTDTATQDPSHICVLHHSHGNARSLIY